jgi:L-threonylcarbamoyladenylate synthase
MMEFLLVTGESLERAAACLRGGGLVAFPTETVYGLGADAFNPAALAKVFEAKRRPRFDPLIIHIAALKALEKIADFPRLSKTAKAHLAALAETFWPGPISLILPKQKAVPDLATSGLPTVAVRFPSHPAAQKLIALAGGAVAAPSANPFGYLSPTRAEHVRGLLGEKVDIILDGGHAEVGVESTVLDITGERPCLLRPGGVPLEKIEALIGPVESSSGEMAKAAGENTANNTGIALASPGLLKSHYAPRTPVSVFSAEAIAALPVMANGSCAFLFFDGATRDLWQLMQGKKNAPAGTMPKDNKLAVKTLSERGDTLEAAANLFQLLHELDNLAISQINAQLAPEQGLGAAINDRLKRAAHSVSLVTSTETVGRRKRSLRSSPLEPQPRP